MEQVLHVDFISLKQDATPADREAVTEAAASLVEVSGVLQVALIEGDAESDYELAFLFRLPHYIAIEPFGTDTRYVRFLQGIVAPRLRAFSGADLRLENEQALTEGYAACLALSLPEETYDWEVKERLDAWTGDTSALVGVAVGEPGRYRGVAIALGSSRDGLPSRVEAPGTTYVRGRLRTLS